MTIRISSAIMAHPRRRDAAEALRDRYPELELRVVLDPEPDGPPSALRTSLLAWGAVGADVTHHLVIQDDAVAGDGFPAQLRRAVAAQPDRPIGLFTEWGSRTANALRIATVEGASWVEAVDPFVPAFALVLPAWMARGFVSFAAGYTGDAEADDLALQAYLRGIGAVTYVAVPNLVDHSCIPSLLGHDLMMGPRRSPCVEVDGDVDGSGRQWAGGAVVDLTAVPHLSTMQGRSVCCVRPEPDSRDWSTVATPDWLAGQGIGRDTYDSGYRSALAGTAAARDVVSDVLLYEVWLTAFAYGTVLALRAGRGDGEAWLDHALDRPLARQALPTLVAGGLRRLVPAHRLEEMAGKLAGLVRTAVRSGFTAGRSAPGAHAEALPAKTAAPVTTALATKTALSVDIGA